MATVFGEVADAYDEVRPGYPDELGAAIVAYHGPVTSVVEIGAGTGKGTAALVGLGGLVTCVEPDPRMARVLQARYPSVRVYAGRFEDWVPPDGGVPLIACAMAWHWLDEATRNVRVHAALAAGGTLAVFGHVYRFADPAQEAAVGAAYASLGSDVPPRADDWFQADIENSGLFTDVRRRTVSRAVPMTRDGYLRLVRTFSPFLRKSARERAREVEVVGATVGDTVTLDLRTTLVLARRQG